MKTSICFLSGAIASTMGILAATACEIQQANLVTIQSLTSGDRACYVEVLDDKGETKTEFATFDICEQDLVGKQVHLHYEFGEIVAEECNGDIECGLSETVMLITEVKLAKVSAAMDDNEGDETARTEKEQNFIDSTINSKSPLPILNSNELTLLATNLEDAKNQWFGLAGFLKVEQPPIFTEELQAYRKGWMAKNPAIAPFLGFWHNEESEGYRYSLNVFPAVEPGQVCILEYQPERSLLLTDEATGKTVKDLISAEILSLSVGQVQSGQLQSSEISTAITAIAREEYTLSETYDVELTSVLDNEGEMRVLAAAAPPALPEEFPQELAEVFTKTLAEQGCTETLPTENE
ncbi:MAG: hypothetical protein WBB82_16680 [Limnothrix sp.]